MRFQEYVTEASNTPLADINEILLGFYMVDGNWTKYDDAPYIKKQLEMRKSTVPPEEFAEQEQRASTMAAEVKQWMKMNGYEGKVIGAWWTARPGILGKAVGTAVDSKKNPTDVLVKTSEGKFLGLSAKSTKGKGDIGFKNPGIGTLDRVLGSSLSKIEDEEISKLLSMHPEIPPEKSHRKTFVRATENAPLHVTTEEAGDRVMTRIRDSLFEILDRMSQTEIRTHILDNWMDAEELYPPYIKVTGHGNGGKYSAVIMNPLKNSHIDHLNHTIQLQKIGTNSIGITGGGNKVMKMRVKYESEKLASGVKLSGDPW
jgi:hypothetical protein